MTAADRPSVTDNARDEEPLAWCPGCGDRILTRVVRERGVCSECWGTRDDPWAAGRAETTTATTEDAQTGTFEAILAAHRDEYDSDCGMYFGCSCGWDNDDIGSNEGYVEHVAGLLATARTRPTLAELSLRLALEMDCERVYDDNANAYYCNEHDVGWLSDTNQCARAERLADAVLALLVGDDK